MPALHRAVALEEVHRVPVLVAQHLHLDVAGVLQELLDEDRAVAEGVLGSWLALRRFVREHASLAVARRACRARRRPPRP